MCTSKQSWPSVALPTGDQAPLSPEPCASPSVRWGGGGGGGGITSSLRSIVPVVRWPDCSSARLVKNPHLLFKTSVLRCHIFTSGNQYNKRM